MTNPIKVKKDELALACFYRWERERADHVFMTQPLEGAKVTEITWGEAGQQVRGMASWIKAQGWPAGSKIAIFGKNSAHWVLADLAIWMAGHVSVPIYPTFNGDALHYILEHSESRACFVGKLDDVSALKNGIPPGVPLIALPLAPGIKGAASWDKIVADTKALVGHPLRSGDDLATIIYTSGTTGNPKGVMQSFAAMAWALSSGAQRVVFNHKERMLSYLPLAHVVERVLVEQGSLRYGSHIFFTESLDTFVQDISRARPTIFFSVPSLWIKFQQGVHHKIAPTKLKLLLSLPVLGGILRRKLLKGLGLSQCRLAVGGAAPMPPELLRWYRDLGLDMIECYGMTENCAISHATLPGTFRPGTVGQPYPGVESRIDANSGEIQMRCPAVMMGYFKDPEQTAATMTKDGWLRTGDKGVVEKDGCLRITGRVKDIFKTSKGKYVAPAPIEDLIATHPDIEACAVTGASFSQPLGIVMLSADAVARAANPDAKNALMTSLAAHLKSVNTRLESHEQLDCLAVVVTAWTPENGLVTPTFKVKRPKIEDVYSSQYEDWLKKRKPVIWVDAAMAP